MYKARQYREITKHVLQQTVVVQNESDLQVFFDQTDAGIHESLNAARQQIERMIQAYPEFQTSLTPLPQLLYTPEAQNPVIHDMLVASNKAGVGPMAAVAGTISKVVGQPLLQKNNHVIVENGGDLFLASQTERRILIHAGSSPLSEKLAIVIPPGSTPLGICTSSGTVGHSLSFGKTDATVIIAKNTSLADAVATATGNLVREGSDLEAGIHFAKSIEGVEFVAIIIGEQIAVWGDYKLAPAQQYKGEAHED